MTYPGNGEAIGKRSTAFYVDGFTPEPNQTVVVWAKKNNGGWLKLTETKTLPTDYSVLGGPGGPWYRWLKQVVVPSNCWKYQAPSLYSAELKATTLDGTELYTFEKGFADFREDYDDVLEMYEDHGAGTRVTIFAAP
jgi:hypothetical protein